jgi:hypothetical protein
MRQLALTISAALAVVACTTDDPGDSEDAAETVASAVESSSELARLTAPLQATPDLQGLPPPQAIQQKIDDAASKFRLLVANDGCLAIATTPTSIAVTFTACRFALVFRIDGSLSASVGFELDGIGRPAVLVLHLASPGLVVVGPLRSRRLAGDFTLRHPVAGVAPVIADVQLDFDNDAGAALALSAHAEWTIAGSCATVTGGGQITGTAFGAVAIAERDVHACRNTCPDAGTVELSFGRGELLRWAYTGAGTASVIGPRGRALEVPLACGGDG